MSNIKVQKKVNKTELVRHLVQLAAFVVFPGLFVLTFSAFGEIVHALVAGTFSVAALSSQLLLAGAVTAVTAIFGRFFCGYLCSFGAAGDLFWKLGRLLRLPRLRLSERADRALKKVKYAVLALFAALSWALGYALPASADPWNVFGQVAVVGSIPAVGAFLSLGGALLALILLASMLEERVFCRYLCPLGGLLSGISHFRVFRIRKPRIACGSCHACSANCPMGISLGAADRVESDECINCMSCVSICPRKNVQANPIPALSTVLALGTMSSFYFAGSLTAAAAEPTVIPAVTAAASVQSVYADGTYTGSAAGYRGTTTVSVTVSGGVITAIDVISDGDTASFFNKAKSAVIAEILAAQDTDVDTVSGATFSSNGIIGAVEDALQSAQSSADTIVTADDAQAADTAAAADSASSDSAASVSGSYADGTYTGSGTGLRGTTSVTVTVSGGEIADITVDSYADDQQFFTRAESTVISEILAAQSTDVDTVSGATFSSNGIIEAVADALGIDFTNPNAAASASAGRH